MKITNFALLSLILHFVFIWLIPITMQPKLPEDNIVEFIPLEQPRKPDSVASINPEAAAITAAPAPERAVQTPPAPAPKPQPKTPSTPAPAPKPAQKPVEKTPEPVPAAAEPLSETVKEDAPTAAEQEKLDAPEETPVIEDTPAAAVPEVENTAPEENNTADEESEPIEEILDGRVDVPTVQEFVGDRIRGQIEFKGNGRKFTNQPAAPNFRLSNNTVAIIEFKIDRFGNTYDIVISPISNEVELMLTDFVSKMRFGAVLYDEPDTASMTITLQVR